MAVFDGVELGAVLVMGEWERIEGTAEADWVDFHRLGYESESANPRRLTAKGRWELCKDVAAFANRSGGSIVLGVPTSKDEHTAQDLAGVARPIAISAINLDAYKKLLASGVYPQVRDLRIQWCLRQEGDTDGLLLIHVPPQGNELKPFVVRRMVSDEAGETGSIGIPEREDDGTIWWTAEEVHHRVRRASVDILSVEHRAATAAHSEERARVRADEIDALLDWEERAVYLLQALPPASSGVRAGFYNDGGPVDALAQPNEVRPNGFGLHNLGPLQVIGGSAVARQAGDATAWLEPDGFFTVAVLAEPIYLGWAWNDGWPQASHMRIHPLVLVELTLEFFRYTAAHLIGSAAGEWTFVVRCRRFESNHVALPHGLGRKFPTCNLWEASGDEWTQTFSSDVPDAERLAFEALSRTYMLFGLGEDAIPFSDLGERRIQSESLR